MDPAIYKIIHFVGIMLLFLGIGALISGAVTKSGDLKVPAMLHGAGFLFLLISGFGMSAKLKIGFPDWMLYKLVILLVLGAMIVLAKRRILPPLVLYLLAIVLGGVSAYLGFSNSVILRPTW